MKIIKEYIKKNIPCKVGIIPMKDNKVIGDELLGCCIDNPSIIDDLLEYLSSVDPVAEFSEDKYKDCDFKIVIKKEHTNKGRGEFTVAIFDI